MPQSSERSYLEHRLRQECDAADRARDVEVRTIHLDFQGHYRQRLQELGDGSRDDD